MTEIGCLVSTLMTDGKLPNDGNDKASADFAPTRWSVVLEARTDSTARREALEHLCSAYWLPIYGYLRRRQHSPADAEDLTQAFLAEVIESDFLDRADPAKGRFRGYLVGALKHFLGSHFEREKALKRGGGAIHLDWANLDAENEFAALDQADLDPSEAYETTWAMTLMSRALKRLEAEQRTAGKGAAFEVLRGYLSSTPTRGDYDRAARQLDASRPTVAVWVHRLNQRYGELIKLEVAATVQDPEEVKNEMRHVFLALQRAR